MNNNKFNPFLIYTDRNNLYIKGVNKPSEKIYSNVSFYCANIDDNQNINICCINKNNRLIYITKNDGLWVKKNILSLAKNYKHIQNMKLYVIDGKMNIFITQHNPFQDNLYRIYHILFDNTYSNISSYKIDNIIKSNGYIYKINIDEDKNSIELIYNLKCHHSRGISTNSICFDSISNTWISVNDCCKFRSIQEDVLEFCYGLSYIK